MARNLKTNESNKKELPLLAYIKKFKLLENLPCYSDAFKDNQKTAILKEFVISKYLVGLKKEV